MIGLDSDFAKPSGAVVRVFVSIAVAMMLLASAALMARPAAAQSARVPHAEVVTTLGDKYAEKSVALGIARNGGVIELFTSEDGSTWTIVLTMPNGMSQVIASGESWMDMTPVAGRRPTAETHEARQERHVGSDHA